MKKNIALFSCVLVLLFLGSCAPNSTYIRRMQSLEEGVDSPTTIDELKVAIGKYQKRVEDILNADIRTGIWYKILATRYLDNRLYGKALENFRTAIEFYPMNQNLYYYVGVCAGYMANASLDYEATGSTAERDRYLALSESGYLRAIEIEPRYARALYGLGVLYVFELNQSEKAIPLLESLLDIEKKNIDAMFVLARAYFVTGSNDASVTLYDRIIATTKDPVRKTNAETNKAQVLDQTYGKE